MRWSRIGSRSQMQLTWIHHGFGYSALRQSGSDLDPEHKEWVIFELNSDTEPSVLDIPRIKLDSDLIGLWAYWSKICPCFVYLISVSMFTNRVVQVVMNFNYITCSVIVKKLWCLCFFSDVHLRTVSQHRLTECFQ